MNAVRTGSPGRVPASAPPRAPSPYPAVAQPMRLPGHRPLPNRLCILPMEGCDADAQGVPGPLTLRRYTRLAAGGAGLIWMEAIAISADARSNPRQLVLAPHTVAALTGLLRAIRDAAPPRHETPVAVIAQLAHAGPYARPDGVPRPMPAARPTAPDPRRGIFPDTPTLDDAGLVHVREDFIAAARRAREAGFDGVDIACCQGNLLDDLLGARERTGVYGGGIAGGAQLLHEIFEGVARVFPEGIAALRLTLPHVVPEALWTLITSLRRRGLALLNPWVPPATGPPRTDPAGRVRGQLRRIRRRFPDLALVAGGFSARAGTRLDTIAAGILSSGEADLVGLGRAALAQPAIATALLDGTPLQPGPSCVDCGACDALLRWDGPVGCVLRDTPIYADIHRHRRQTHPEPLREAAQHCRDCHAADCSAACPARLDIPSMIRAFAANDLDGAYQVARAGHPLPGITAHLCPAWMQCEGACIQGSLQACTVPIRDIQSFIVRQALRNGRVGARVPQPATGRRIAVIGGGPAGLAGATALVEAGHTVTLFERERRLGGLPALVIPQSRFPDTALREIDALLDPAIAAGRLRTIFGRELGRHEHLEALCKNFDAVLLAAGLWRERPPAGDRTARDALDFLQRHKAGAPDPMPPSVALLCGGDCAMDAAVAARERGAQHLFLIFDGPLSDMHWHLPVEWLRKPGVHVMPLTRVRKLRQPPAARDIELVLEPQLPEVRTTDPHASRTPDPPAAWRLNVGAVISARGLVMDEILHAELAPRLPLAGGRLIAGRSGPHRTRIPNLLAAGALVNGGASVVQCMVEGIEAAREIEALLQGRRPA